MFLPSPPPVPKALVLLFNALLAQIGAKSPNPVPNPNEVQSFQSAASTQEDSWFLTSGLPLRAHISSIIDITEAYLILSRAYPSTQLPIPHSLFGSLPPNCFEQIHISASFSRGCLLLYAGGLLRLYCFKHMGPNFTYQLAIVKNHTLTTTGPYALVRHPSYTAVLLILWGVLRYQLGYGSWLGECVWRSYPSFGSSGAGAEVVLILGRILVWMWIGMNVWIGYGLVRRIPKEDEALRKVFGMQWEIYAMRTPYKLVPWVY